MFNLVLPPDSMRDCQSAIGWNGRRTGHDGLLPPHSPALLNLQLSMMSTFEALTRACAAEPTRDRMTFLHEDGKIEVATGEQLLTRSAEVSEGLRRIATPGDRILLAYPAGIDFVVGFLGCLHAGMIPVPVTYPKPRRPLSRYARIASDSEATLALTSTSMLELIDPHTLSANHECQIPWHCERTLAKTVSRVSAVPAEPRGGDDVVFLQYTSGSTSDPKGVMITHNNIMANLDVIDEGFQIDRLSIDQRVVCSWLPAYHDMGLVGVILSSLIHDGHAVMMSPTSFVKRPVRWLKAISDYNASITVAPTFGYQWAAAKVSDADLAEDGISLDTLQLAACGAEPIHLPVLEQFTQRFAPIGFQHETFYPCYGLAESTLMVTGTVRSMSDSSGTEQLPGPITLPGPVTTTISRSHLHNNLAMDPESESDRMQIVSCGVAGKNTLLRVLDTTTHLPCDENHVGEIQVQSASVASGYWNDSDRTAEAFDFPAHRNGNPATQASLRTGDLGFLRDGHLYVTGRLKDLIIIGGQNHYPQDIERSVCQSHPRLADALSATFSVVDNEIERLVVVHEVPRGTTDEECEAILRAIRMAIAQNHDLAVQEIVLIRPATLPRTSSGKVQRQLCRQLYISEELNTILSWRHTDALDPALFPEISELLEPPQNPSRIEKAIQSTLLSWLEEHLSSAELESSEIRSDQSFAELGVDSLLAVELSQQLERWLGVKLSPVAAWSYPTPQSLAKHLCSLVIVDESEAVQEVEQDNGYAELLDQIANMDEDEVDELLRNMN